MRNDDPFETPTTALAELYELAETIEGLGSLVTVFGVASDLDGPAHVHGVFALRQALWDSAEKLKNIHDLLKELDNQRVCKELFDEQD